jgi:Reverse transcriptase (RNA-dependent DNA polymerase)
MPLNEVPGTKFTAIMAPPAASRAVHALRHPHGHLLGPGVGQANLMVQHYAAISTAPAPQPAALQEVLQAIPAHGPVGLPHAAADALGDPTVTVSEIRQALRHSRPGTCPGFDGIPVELYRKAGQPMLQLLARVFSAVADTGTTPSNFLDGVVTSIFKDGDPTLPSNYRPITLLNTDYRILAKVLANRCLQHIPHLISAEQCAFLKGRSIGDSIMLLQLLPHQLAAEGHTGALVAFLDFRKAYDSVSREFLREVLLAMGVGDKFVAWVMLLLDQQRTRACAVLNGYKSVKAHFAAGVRQGCPLSPLLYLFVGEALLRFMKAQQALGVTLAGGRVVAAQYADDIDPVLEGPQAVPVLVNTLSKYAAASNQHINVDKCKLLPVGRPSPAPVPDSISGIPVVDAASTLGITFHSGLSPPTPKRDWDQLLSGVQTKLDKLGRLSLSAFGRAMGASTYALSRLLFYMEYAGLPTARQLADLERALAKLVDRGNKSHAFTYVRKELLVGRVKEGGFGLLQVQQHVLARHAVLAVKLLTGDAAVPWIRLGRALLRHLWGPGWHPLLPLLPEAQHVHAAADDTRVAPMPAPLTRLFHALHQLPRVRDVAGGLQLQPWVCSAPLIGNPWLQNDQGQSLGRGVSAVAGFLGCCTVGGLAHMCRTLATVSSEEWQCGPWGMVRRDLAWQHVQKLLQYVPRAWLDIAISHASQQPQGQHHVCHDAVQTLLSRLGWWAREPGRMMPRPVPMSKLTVRVAYKMLIQPNIDMRRSRWADFIAETYGVQPDQVQDAQLASLRSLLTTVWHRVKWRNKHKVLFWQLTVYGLPTSANRNTGTSCFCDAPGHECPGRKHHMWDCPAAQAVVAELCTCLGIANAGLQRHHLWLMEMPLQMLGPVVGNVSGLRRVLHEVWMVVCLAALRAMWSTAKKVMHAGSRARMASNPRGMDVVAAETAVVCFWDLLHDFCESDNVPADWRQLLLPGMPFLHVMQPGGAVVVNNGVA